MTLERAMEEATLSPSEDQRRAAAHRVFRLLEEGDRFLYERSQADPANREHLERFLRFRLRSLARHIDRALGDGSARLELPD